MEKMNVKLKNYEDSQGIPDFVPARGMLEYCNRRFKSEERILCYYLGSVGEIHLNYPLEDYCSERAYTVDENQFMYRRYYKYTCFYNINSIPDFGFITQNNVLLVENIKTKIRNCLNLDHKLKIEKCLE